MKSRCLFNSCHSTSQFISKMYRCSFFCLFFYQIKNFLFLLWVNLYIITGIYLHDPPPFNGPFFVTPPFSESQKVVTLPLFPPPPPLLISDKSLIYLEKFESDLSKINEDIAPQSHEILQTFVWWELIKQTSVNSRNFAELYFRSFQT